jgi:hypothetical protein
MWRHVHDIFTAEHATNVTWVWSVNTEYAGSSDLAGLYPGDSYVDWAAMDGYNWGTNPAKPDSWKSFSQVFTQTYNRLGQVASAKPVMLSEFASTEFGGSKSGWITDALTTQLPQNFSRIKAIVWFNMNAYEGSGRMDWIIESSSSSQAAFSAGISTSSYAANDFAALNTSPIPPLSSIPTPTATRPAATSTLAASPTAVSATPTVVGATPTTPPVNNLILNPSFELVGTGWLTPWNFVTGSGAAGSISQDGITRSNGVYSTKLVVSTSTPTAPWGVQINQKNLSLNIGNTITGSFWAKASAARDLMIVVQMGVSPYTEYFRRTYTLSTAWQQYTFSYNQAVSVPNAMLAINAAQATGSVWIDQVSVIASGGSPAPTSTPVLPTATPVVPTATQANPTPTQTIPPTSPAPTSTQVPPLTPTAAPDNEPPSISITNPLDGNQVPRRKTVTITVNASDNVGIDRVEFLVTGSGYSWSCIDATGGFSCSWRVPADVGVQYTIRATAFDTSNNSSIAEVSVTAR